MTLYCSPRGRTGKGRGPEGSGLYPELAAYRISEGCSPNVQAEVGRLVGLLPIEQARAELARQGLEQDEKAVRRIAGELGAQMLATRTRDLMRFRRGELPAGNEFAGKSVAVGIDGGRVRVRTIVKKIRVSGKTEAEEVPGRVARAQGCHPFRSGQEGAHGSGKPPRHRRHAPRPRCVDRIGRVSFAPNGCCPGQCGDLRGRRRTVDLEAVGLGRRPGQAGSVPGGRGARLVSCRAPSERGVGGFASGRGPAEGALQAASGASQRGQEPRS